VLSLENAGGSFLQGDLDRKVGYGAGHCAPLWQRQAALDRRVRFSSLFAKIS
jgi:hypothetical protein